MISRHETSAQFDEGLTELARFWDSLMGQFSVSTGLEKPDRMVNIWNQYQCMVTFNMSRSASYFESGMAETALASVKEKLDTEYGTVLLQPPYTRYRKELGEITSYPPGYKENAGIFYHNNPWIVCAETVLGHGNRAFELYKKTCPAFIEDISDIHRTEPYVYSQMIAGKDAPSFGEAKNSWLTGTAAWTFVSISQAILGIIPTMHGLKIDPCLPDEIQGFTAKRLYRGAVYEITVEKGGSSVFANGEPIEGKIIPVAEAGATVDIKVMI